MYLHRKRLIPISVEIVLRNFLFSPTKMPYCLLSDPISNPIYPFIA